ncbi:MAG: ferritin, partial [Bacteroidales bacterium]|nr:ferritin [Bacteroidales bacterium]
MINKQLQDAINAQINAELWSAYLYLSMATNFHEMGLGGIANWFEVQFKEEQDHAMIFYNYLVSRGGRVELKAIDAVKTKWESPLEAFEDTLRHEQKV